MRQTLALLGTATGVLVTRAALAAEPFGVESPSSAPPALSGTEQAVVARYWELGRVRPFMAASIEAGYAYVRPRFAAGYGRPFWLWFGIEAYPLASLGGVGHYSGLTASIPWLSLRLGSRYYYPFSRSFLPPQESFKRADIELLRGPKADYLAYEGELTTTFPLLSGSVFAVLTGYRTALVPEGYLLFEESLRAVMKPPYIWRTRVGYLLALGRTGSIRIGAVAEVIGLPGRDEYVLRSGLLGSVLVSPALEAQASFVPVILSPDNLGLAGGDFGQLGLRWRWATASRPDPKKLRDAAIQRLQQQESPQEP